MTQYESYNRDNPGEVVWFLIMGDPMMLLRKGLPADSFRVVYGAIRKFLSILKANCVKMELLRSDLGPCDSYPQCILEDQVAPVASLVASGQGSVLVRLICEVGVFIVRFSQKLGLCSLMVVT